MSAQSGMAWFWLGFRSQLKAEKGVFSELKNAIVLPY